MTTQSQMIDFRKIEGPVYTGRKRGELLRGEFHLDDTDTSGADVEVDIPEGTYAISSSFFLGLFGPSVIRAGSKDAFYSRYHFKSPDFLKSAIDEYVSRALQTSSLNKRIAKNNTSGSKGVSKRKNGDWSAQAWKDGKQIHLYQGPSLLAAIQARSKWEYKNIL